MRHDPSSRMLRLVQYLSATRLGATTEQMAEEIGVQKRTIERMRGQIDLCYPGQLSYTEDDNRVRRWKLVPRAIPQIAPDSGTFATLEALAHDLNASGDHARAADLREALTCLHTMVPDINLRKAEPDIEALMQAEGVAMQPGPRQRLSRELLGVIREAILSVKKLSALYKSNHTGESEQRILCPYGVLYGRRAYLVAHEDNLSEMKLWRLDRLSEVEVNRDNFKPQIFSLAEYAQRSFGVFQDEPQRIILKFSPSAAAEAAEWQFHPTQMTQIKPDGSLFVEFTCGGMRELSWHLYTWGDTVEVLAPEDLKNLCART